MTSNLTKIVHGNKIIMNIIIILYSISITKAFHLFSYRQSTSKTLKTKTNPIIGVGPFLGDQRYNECNLFLTSSSTNGKLNQDDYAKFLSLYSYGYINSTSFIGLSDYSLAYINLFYSYSCNPKCDHGFQYGALKSTNAIQILESYNKEGEYCCEDGVEQPYIEIENSSIDSLFYICAYADEYIREDVKEMMMSGVPSESPSVVFSEGPSVVNSSVPSLLPTVSPSGISTVSPSASPTLSPTNKPTFSPTRRPTLNPTIRPTNTPTNTPTTSPTPKPTPKPSTQPSSIASSLPSILPTSTPTSPPTTSQPTITPTSIPTLTPSTSTPTSSPSNTPTGSPTSAPTSSTAPTAFGKDRTEFAYRITVLGYDAQDILTGNNNTIKEDLIAATTIVVKRVLATGDPCIPIPRKLRKLAEYRDYSPVEILSVIDVDCSGLALIQKSNNGDTNCILIRSAVTIYCTDPEEDCQQIQEDVINGIRDSIENGCFFEALPML